MIAPLPKKYIDLHSHSTHSDGSLTPQELVSAAAERNVSILALTDHDTVSGIGEAMDAGLHKGVEVLPSIELSVRRDPGTMHLLGYFVDHESEDFLERLAGVQKIRAERNLLILENLNKLGISLTFEEVAEEADGGQIGRPHFARALIKKGTVKSFDEAFRKFLADGAPAYVRRDSLEPAEGIRLIHDAGGLAVLAHPRSLAVKMEEGFETVLAGLADAGLDGIEVYCSSQGSKESEFYKSMALKYDLFSTGGSDFHGAGKAMAELGILGVHGRMNDSIVEEMRSYLGR